VKEKIDDWKREGLLGDDCATIWKLEFEDCFSSNMISKAINDLAKENGLEFEVNHEELDKARAEGKSVVRVLQKMLFEKGLPHFSKPELAEKLAILLAEDIKNNPNHKKTPPELTIEEIVKKVESK